MGEIVNRVAKSPLVTLDLEEYYPSGTRSKIDIAPWLYEGIILKETGFRQSLEEYDWSQYQDHFVALYCSADAIIPSWAYLLVSTKLAQYARKVVVGDLNLLESIIFSDIIANIDVKQFEDRPVIVKGCAKITIPESAFTELILKIQPVAKSLMYGEACSTVPLYKKPKK